MNDGLKAWQLAVSNVRVRVFEEPKDRILKNSHLRFPSRLKPVGFKISIVKETSKKDDKKLKIVVVILCLLVIAALLPAYLKGLYPDKL